MPDELSARLIVMDTAPLITLAVAESLDFLLYPGIPVAIPDAVLYEATRDASKLGATDILGWAKAHYDLVGIAPTNVYVVFTAARLRRIQSADAVVERALARGRTPSRNERLAAHEADVQRTVAALVRPWRDTSLDG